MQGLTRRFVKSALGGLVTFSILLSPHALAGEYDCGVLQNHGGIGPWDYYDPSSSAKTGEDPMGRIKRVENVHFKAGMRNLNTKEYDIERLTAEITYTLSVFPNHPDALLAVTRLEKMAGGKLPQRSVDVYKPRISAHCFFDRALRFRPEQPAVRFSYAIYLHQQGKYAEALEHYKFAEKTFEENPFFQYNLGLLYSDMKNWPKATEYAERAYRGGAIFPGLRQRIEKAGFRLDLSGGNAPKSPEEKRMDIETQANETAGR